MIDIHCHILPKVDDGSSGMEESLDMAHLAASSGVTDIVATPHFRGEAQSVELASRIIQGCQTLQRRIQENHLPVTIHPGAEILCLPGTVEMARKGLLPTLGGGKYILTEFYFDESWEYMDQILRELQRLGYRPVVAHPERYGAIQRRPLRIREWFDCGIAIQLNKGSVLGAFGSRAKQTAVGLLEDGLAHVIATDAHGAEMRTTHIGPLLRWTQEHLDPSYERILLQENPGRILRDQELVPV